MERGQSTRANTTQRDIWGLSFLHLLYGKFPLGFWPRWKPVEAKGVPKVSFSCNCAHTWAKVFRQGVGWCCLCQGPLQFTLTATSLNPEVTSARGKQGGQAVGAAGSWGPPLGSLREHKSYSHTRWFYCMVQLNKLHLRLTTWVPPLWSNWGSCGRTPQRQWKSWAGAACPLNRRPGSGHFPNINCRTACSKLRFVAWPFSKSWACTMQAWLEHREGLPINMSLQHPFHFSRTFSLQSYCPFAVSKWRLSPVQVMLAQCEWCLQPSS